MVEKNPITPEGVTRLKEELAKYRAERPRIVEQIAHARELGDLKENAEYHAAKERQGQIEEMMRVIEDKLARAEVIDPKTLAGDKVAFGATVTLQDENEKTIVYKLVGADETDVARGFISVTSPMARSLIGKEVGDEVKTRTPGGERLFEILSIEFK